MRRFNQAWLLAPDNVMALWGMALVEMGRSRAKSSLELFREAALRMPSNIELQVGAASAKSVVANETGDQTLNEEAWADFKRINEADPTNSLILEAWAASYFFSQRYKDAWDVVTLAEKTPGASRLDDRFIQALGRRMPRP